MQFSGSFGLRPVLPGFFAQIFRFCVFFGEGLVSWFFPRRILQVFLVSFSQLAHAKPFSKFSPLLRNSLLRGFPTSPTRSGQLFRLWPMLPSFPGQLSRVLALQAVVPCFFRQSLSRSSSTSFPSAPGQFELTLFSRCVLGFAHSNSASQRAAVSIFVVHV